MTQLYINLSCITFQKWPNENKLFLRCWRSSMQTYLVSHFKNDKMKAKYLQEMLTQFYPDVIRIAFQAEGKPDPEILWFKHDAPVTQSSSVKVSSSSSSWNLLDWPVSSKIICAHLICKNVALFEWLALSGVNFTFHFCENPLQHVWKPQRDKFELKNANIHILGSPCTICKYSLSITQGSTQYLHFLQGSTHFGLPIHYFHWLNISRWWMMAQSCGSTGSGAKQNSIIWTIMIQILGIKIYNISD